MSSHNFGAVASVKFNRSVLPMGHSVKTSMSMGLLYPISIVEVLPGDNIKTKMTAVARCTSSFLKPIVDNIYMDCYHFFVPYRLLYENSEQVFGNAAPSAYEDGIEEEFPTFDEKVTIGEKTVGDYLGIPPGDVAPGLSVLPFRAFALIYNQWFRNENVTDEVYVQKGDIVETEIPNNDAWAPNNYCGKLPHVQKRKDYFTSCLPKTQKGQSVSVPLGSVANVIPTGALTLKPTDAGATDAIALNTGSDGGGTGIGHSPIYTYRSNVDDDVPNWSNLAYSSGLSVDLSTATASNVNDLRFAFQLQKMLERDARFGSRYNEFLLGHFSVSNPDSRLQFTEFLGGGRIPIQIQQVAQTSESGTTPLGTVAGFSLSVGNSHFSKGFSEHGFILTVATIRQIHTYQQGVPKMFTRKNRNHFYDPLYANLGEQPVYKTEVYAGASETSLRDNTKVLGYNEAWAEYRYIPNTVTGEMRSSATNSLDLWHLADEFGGAPSLVDEFVEENSDNIDRVLSVPSTSQDNFLVDFYFDTSAVRVMPPFSDPGLIDHH